MTILGHLINRLKRHWPQRLLWFCPDLNKTAQSWVLGQIKTLKTQKQRFSLTLVAPTRDDIVDSLDIQRLLTSTWIPSPLDIQLARSQVDTLKPTLSALTEGLPVSLRDASLFALTYQVIRTEFPALQSLIAEAPQLLKQPYRLLDSALPVSTWQTILRGWGYPDALKSWQAVSVITPERLIHWGERLKADFGNISSNSKVTTSADRQESLSPGSKLVFVGNDRYLAHLDPYVRKWSETNPITVVLYGECSALPDETAQQWSQSTPVRCLKLDAPRYSSLSDDFSQYFTRQSGHASCEDLTLLKTLYSLSTSLLRLDGLLTEVNPSSVIGCFEVSTNGPLLSALKAIHGFELINVQHGNKMPSATLDLMAFDDFKVWNPESETLIREDGYPAESPITVAGNPVIETLRQQINAATPSQTYRELLEWKGESRLIIAYTQYAKGLSNSKQKQRFIQTLLDYLQTHPNTKLAIKAHPSEDVRDIQELTQASPDKDRVRHYTHGTLPLWESYKAADLVTSVFSAVLYEAHMLGLPTVSYDPTCIIDTYHLGLKGLIQVTHSPTELHNLCNALFQPR